MGVQISGEGGASGRVYLDWLTWDGTPNVRLKRPYQRSFTRWDQKMSGLMWKKAWIAGTDLRFGGAYHDFYPETYRIIQNEGRGFYIQGCRDWTDYQVSAKITPHMCKAGGLGARVQGLKRYYALLCDEDSTRLVASCEGKDTVLAQANEGWTFGNEHQLTLKVEGNTLAGLCRWQAARESRRSRCAIQRRRHCPNRGRGQDRPVKMLRCGQSSGN